MPHHSFRSFLMALLPALLLAAAAPTFAASPSAEPAPDDPTGGAAALAAALDDMQAGLVRVEFTLRHDRGEAPSMAVGRRWCEGCGRFHGEAASVLLEEERPLEMPGFLIAPDQVLVHDPTVPPRFIESIRVIGPKGSVAATIDGLALQDQGLFLKLAQPLPGGKALRFGSGSTPESALTSLSWGPDDGVWKVATAPASRRTVVEQLPDGSTRRWRMGEPDSLLVARDGTVEQVLLGGRWLDGQPRPSDPKTWPRLDAAALESLRATTAARADEALLKATLHFRSPRQTRAGGAMDFFGGGDDGEVGTELESIAILLDGGRVLVPASLGPTETARLERIELEDASGATHEAPFVATLRELSALLAKAPDSLSAKGLPLSSHEPIRYRDQALAAATVKLLGRTRVAHAEPVRLIGFEKGWKGLVHPTGVADEESTVVLTPEGELLAVPVATRRKVAVRERWDSEETPSLMPAVALAAILADISAASDASNVPLSEEDEGRTAWLGVLLQPLDPELAAANGVADLTRGGEFGGIVTFVYPGSPAEAAGIPPGAILLAIRAPGQPKPIEIQVDEMDMGYGGVFPWEHLDQLPEEYYDQIPPPWPRIEDRLARTLIELGLGTEYELDLVDGGNTRRLPLKVAQSPPHFDNAPRFEDTTFGITVRDLTTEVRNYLGLPADAPGVVIATLEPGERASVAGLRPFELIVDVDGTPVTGAAQFGTLLEGKESVKLAVKRAGTDRVVQLTRK